MVATIGVVGALLSVEHRDRTFAAVPTAALSVPSPDGLTGRFLDPVDVDTRLVAGDPATDAQWKVRAGDMAATVTRQSLRAAVGSCPVAVWIVYFDRTVVPTKGDLPQRTFPACTPTAYGDDLAGLTSDRSAVVNFIRVSGGGCPGCAPTPAGLRGLGITNAVEGVLRAGSFEAVSVLGVPGSDYGTARQIASFPGDGGGDGTGAAWRASGLNFHGRLIAGRDGRYGFIYRIEVSDDATFELYPQSRTTVATVTNQAQPSQVVVFNLPSTVTARYVRITATALRAIGVGTYALALGELDVNGVAAGACPTATNTSTSATAERSETGYLRVFGYVPTAAADVCVQGVRDVNGHAQEMQGAGYWDTPHGSPALYFVAMLSTEMTGGAGFRVVQPGTGNQVYVKQPVGVGPSAQCQGAATWAAARAAAC